MRWIAASAAVLALAAAAAVAAVLFLGEDERAPEAVTLPGGTMPGRLMVGLQDDASLRWADDRAESLDYARDANASVLRTIVVWRDVVPRRPADPLDPFDPVYALDDLDDLARSAQQRGVELLITIWGTPGWANGGLPGNRPPVDPQDLESFAQALADRYSGRHAGYPAVRLFSAWNEPNLEQFLAPQFDETGGSLSPELYAPLARAVYAGVKRANRHALVAIGETSPRGHDRPSAGAVQDSHSPPRFARLLSEVAPDLPFDAWAQHPYPPRPEVAPTKLVRWPRVGLSNIERFGDSLDGWFGRDGVALWITEYGHETRPGDPLGVAPAVQAEYVEEALALASGNPRIRMFVWFLLRDRPGELWQSGLIAEDGSAKPALATYTDVAGGLDARNPVVPAGAEAARFPVLELAFQTPSGSPIEIRLDGADPFAVPLRSDGWVEVDLRAASGESVAVLATDPHGNSVTRTIEFSAESVELD